MLRINGKDSVEERIEKVEADVTELQNTGVDTTAREQIAEMDAAKEDVIKDAEEEAIADADTIPFTDTSDEDKTKKRTWADLKGDIVNTATLTNLFNGKYNNGCYINTSGSISISPDGLSRTAIIPIEAGKTYTVSLPSAGPTFRVALANSEYNGASISNAYTSFLINNAALTTYTFTNSDGYRYLYFYVSNAGVEPEATITSDEKEIVIESMPVAKKVYVDSKIDSLSNRHFLFGNFSKYYKSAACDDVSPGKTFDLQASTITDIYNAMDALVTAYPTLITKTLLGYGGDSSGATDETLPVYQYAISTLAPDGLVQPPTILLTTGVHGYEKASVWGAVQFITQMLAGWETDDSLASIKNNVIIKYVPVFNPYGYNNNLRHNARNVDINRNFSYKWDEVGAGENQGSSALSEVETQLYVAWLKANANAEIHIDFHNTAETTALSYCTTPSYQAKGVYSGVIRRLFYSWKENYPNATNDAVYAIDGPYATTTMESYHVFGRKIVAVVETARNYNGTYYTSEVIERSVEMLANYILAILDYYKNVGA